MLCIWSLGCNSFPQPIILLRALGCSWVCGHADLAVDRRLYPQLLRFTMLQACRECCGGQGFSAVNRIGPLKNDMDVDVTFEGDNTVMMQQVASLELLKDP